MGLLKEKTTYRPTAPEKILGWIFTALAGAAVAFWLIVRVSEVL